MCILFYITHSLNHKFLKWIWELVSHNSYLHVSNNQISYQSLVYKYKITSSTIPIPLKLPNPLIVENIILMKTVHTTAAKETVPFEFGWVNQ